MSIYQPSTPISTREELREWATRMVRNEFERTPSRWLLEERDCKWALTSGGKQIGYRALAPELATLLEGRWPRQRNRGLSYLGAVAVLDLVDCRGSALAKAEGKRLARLDQERSTRVRKLESVASEVFEAAAGVPALRTHLQQHPYRWDRQAQILACPDCAKLDDARQRARQCVEAWLNDPLSALQGRLPREAAEANDEGLAEALFALEALRRLGEAEGRR